MKFIDRLLTIIITATLTSAAWIIFGGTAFEMANDRQDDGEPTTEEPAPVAPTPAETVTPPSAPPIAVEPTPEPTPAPTATPPSQPSAEPTPEASETPETVEA
ncbi:hypothetical protein [Erythrobacter sp. F6033]|uniref:hypothetical protein n=1 Tax=Erythrobacter sp. F6033 TaxID=2926401 RepID=UPI001FF343F4|nr:hypothetical protein [Erythrobacter sp. F6033]MCK0128543.1 hypothetical protein [Erythrobacter sp. F6033]